MPSPPPLAARRFEAEEWSNTGQFFESMTEARGERAKEDDRATDLLKRQAAVKVREGGGLRCSRVCGQVQCKSSGSIGGAINANKAAACPGPWSVPRIICMHAAVAVQ